MLQALKAAASVETPLEGLAIYYSGIWSEIKDIDYEDSLLTNYDDLSTSSSTAQCRHIQRRSTVAL